MLAVARLVGKERECLGRLRYVFTACFTLRLFLPKLHGLCEVLHVPAMVSKGFTPRRGWQTWKHPK